MVGRKCSFEHGIIRASLRMKSRSYSSLDAPIGKKAPAYITTPELDAIRCEEVLVSQTTPTPSSPPEIIITYRPKLGSLLTDGPSNSRPLHLTLRVHNHASIVLEVEVDAICSPPGLALAHDDGGHDLLPELGLALLDGGHDHVADAAGGEAVQARADALDGDDVEVAGAGVVAAVHDGAAGRGVRYCVSPGGNDALCPSVARVGRTQEDPGSSSACYRR